MTEPTAWIAEYLAAAAAKRERKRQQREANRAEADRVRKHTVPVKTDRRLAHNHQRRNR